jgi:hypothetical protein
VRYVSAWLSVSADGAPVVAPLRGDFTVLTRLISLAERAPAKFLSSRLDFIFNRHSLQRLETKMQEAKQISQSEVNYHFSKLNLAKTKLKNLLSQNHNVYLGKLLKDKRKAAPKPVTWPKKFRESLIPEKMHCHVSINARNFKELKGSESNETLYNSTSDMEVDSPDIRAERRALSQTINNEQLEVRK